MTSAEMSASVQLADRALWAKGGAISYLMQQGIENPQCLSLAAGFVDASTLPVDLVRNATDRLLAENIRGRAFLQYGTTGGAERARRAVLEHFATQEGKAVADLGVDLSRVILTNGSQQFLSLVAQVLLNPGDICLVAAPTYFVFLGTIAGVGAKAITVETDTNGMRPDALDAKLDELDAVGLGDRVKLIYLVSNFENPSGYVLAAERRERIVEIAKRRSTSHRIHVLEDSAYRELRYEGDDPPSVWGCDPDGEHVIYTQTFSKSFSPGLRVGFGIAPTELVAPIASRKGNEDFGSAHLNQHIIASVLADGSYYEHVNEVCESYRRKRDAMVAAAREYFSDIDGVSWVEPRGGLYVWMTLPEHFDTSFDSRLFEIATQKELVMYVPGELCYGGEPAERPRNHMRLSYGVLSPDEITEGIRRLANAIRSL
ncbi:aminotransferase-like domain-containing protein [Stratiformator vulcanicus]|uniref:2-aminoadipate transaminase n=1 Tax=Stratiformator vulcanicus TaxID=2527980 RepID=A0A517R1J3_9PLAN|nr:PLP-dependent aminotransferase family protein [Stratiformator vulcanicus]QDT37767.1 2-aminoadipate transaminase [Stratiformator vulcanicus]